MTVSSVLDLLAADRWTMADVVGPTSGVLRYREPVLTSTQVAGYPQCLRILWGYEAEGSGALPDPQAGVALEAFEDLLVNALEHDALAVLTAVVTLDGARQWVFYTDDARSCGGRISAMPQQKDPYPIELDTFSDPEWAYLRDQVLAIVGRDA